MKKFWNWMKEKEYGGQISYNYDKDRKYINNETQQTRLELPTKQMLIGYMIEYLLTKHIFVGMPSNSDKDRSIEDYYKVLQEEIEK